MFRIALMVRRRKKAWLRDTLLSGDPMIMYMWSTTDNTEVNNLTAREKIPLVTF
jgi:hypothetical protein